MTINFPTTALVLLVLCGIAVAGKKTSPKNVPQNAMLLSNVQSLTLRNGRMTTSRRVDPVPQLTCTGPANICKLYQPDVMRCTNDGADYDAENIQWSCKANLPEEFKLGSTDVICEGFASSDDPYVLKGSCGVEYRLLLTPKGEELYGSAMGSPESYESEPNFNLSSTGTAPPLLFMVIFGAILLIILSGMVNACRRNPPRLGRGGRHGNGGDDDNDPPPPYDSRAYGPRHNPGYAKKPGAEGTTRHNSASRSNPQGRTNDGWRPGPWTAGLAGAGLGYLAGRNSGRADRPPEIVERPGRGYMGSNPGGALRGQATSPSSSSAGPSYSSSRYESTGFGGTTRR